MDRIIELTDENGVKKQFRYLFAVTKEDTDVPYGFFVEVDAQRPEVVVFKFDNEGVMQDLETPEEWEYAQKVFNSYLAQMRGGCGGCHGGCHDDEECGCGDDSSCDGCH